MPGGGAKVKPWAWTLFGLPQVAAQAIEVGGLHLRQGSDSMQRAIRNGVAWNLEDYDHERVYVFAG